MKLDLDKDLLERVVEPEPAKEDSGFYIRLAKPNKCVAKIKKYSYGDSRHEDVDLYRIYKCGVPCGNFLIGTDDVESTIIKLNQKRYCVLRLAVRVVYIDSKDKVEIRFVKCVYDTVSDKIVYIHDNDYNELSIYKNILVVKTKKLVIHMPTMNVVYKMPEPYGDVSMSSENTIFVCDNSYHCKLLIMINTENGTIKEMQVE